MFYSCGTVLTSSFLLAGQIELYTHLPVMRQLVEQLHQWEFRVCGVFLVDSQFMVESFKVTDSLFCVIISALNVVIKASVKSHIFYCLYPQFISGVMAALSAMVSLEIPQVNIMTKMDLLNPKAKKEIEK